MSKAEKLKERARALETKDPKGAIEAWLEILKAQDDEGDANPDLAIYNRIGDLFLKLKDPGQAADYYDRAVDAYAELGFHNNAIAMCNKVLRNAPARQTTYLKLAKLYAAKGFIAEAKQNFIEYAERMQRAGKIEHAFAALKEFADLSSEGNHLREMLEEHLRMYGDPGRRPSTRLSTPAAPKAPSHATDDLTKSGKRKTSSLVFLDLDEPPVKKRAGGAPHKAPAPPRTSPPPSRAPDSLGLITPPEPELDTSLEIERTSLGDEAESTPGSALEGLELTSADFGAVRASAPPGRSLREELTPPSDPGPLAGLEPTVPDEEGLEEEGTEEAEPEPAPPPRPRFKAAPPVAAPKLPPLKAPAPKGAPEAPKVKPVVPKRPPGPAGTAPAPPTKQPPGATPPKRKTVVEIPPLELEPDFDSVIRESTHDVDDQPLAIDDGERKFVQTEDDTSISAGRRSGYIDLGVSGVVNQGDLSSSLVFDNIEQAPVPSTIAQLEALVADNPDDPEAHQALGEALIEEGERGRGVEELDLATAGYEGAGKLQEARDLVDEILRLDPNSIRHRQKGVEFAFKAGDKAQLIDAYLELADTLLRADLPEKARAVYQRVAEHDPSSERARAALSMLAPAAAPTKSEGKVRAKDAKMTVRQDAGSEADFVDLSAMILDEVEPEERDTRMKVADEEPTGDEELDFHEMLARFKQGIEENIDETDFQSHYDLGVAFKEMGLLDEAIAELQKALRAPEGKLRTSEALGVCFFEKGAYTVAESILRRGLELPASGDQERLGVLYWLGRALEEQGSVQEARELYGRVFAVDIRFMDVGDRVKALAKARR